MYNCLTKITFLSVLGIVVLFGLQNQVLGFELDDEIYQDFKKVYKEGYKDNYLDSSYVSNFSKDPYGDALKDEENKLMQLKIAGVEYIEKELAAKNCSLSQKKLWSILYYFVPEFRSELARSMKMRLGDYSSKNFVFDEDEILGYCREYFVCEESQNYSAFQIFTDTLKTAKDENGNIITDENGKKISQHRYNRPITYSTPANVKTNCKEFFQNNYRIGENSEQRVQNVQNSWVGADKYWNSTTDDSPYDIMVDMGNIGKLLYQDAEPPIKPVFYHLPIFNNSKQALSDHKKTGSSYGDRTNKGNNSSNQGGSQNNLSDDKSNPSGNGGGNGVGTSQDGGGVDSSKPIPLRSGEGFSMEGGYDDLVEGLGAYSIVNDDSIYYGSLCEEIDAEPESPVEIEKEKTLVVEEDMDQFGRDVSNLSSEESKILIDYMLGAVNEYASLPDDKKKEMEKNKGDTNKYASDTTPEQLEETANEIKNCWKSCEGLRPDQKASCMLMCACGEIKSPIFDPENTPGLGPIFMIRFCTVPTSDTKFSVGGSKIISIEKGVKEIYGVTDKLSREGRLGIRTQQNNFLDSTTKKMKVADTFAFTIDMEFVDIFDKMPKYSEQYQKKEMADVNEVWQTAYGISNKINNPVSKNRYIIVGYQGESVNDFKTRGDADAYRKSLEDPNKNQSPITDPNKGSTASRYNDTVQILDRWFNQQATLWKEILGYVNELDASSRALYAKPKIN